MAGLQGVGKTTTCGKLALSLKKENRKVLLVATDVYRPAAIEQLRLLGRKTAVDVFDMGTDADPVEIATRGLEKARAEGYDTVIVDTAGRLQAGSPPPLPPPPCIMCSCLSKANAGSNH
jgi:signal recognition particle subunit SRP54